MLQELIGRSASLRVDNIFQGCRILRVHVLHNRCLLFSQLLATRLFLLYLIILPAQMIRELVLSLRQIRALFDAFTNILRHGAAGRLAFEDGEL